MKHSLSKLKLRAWVFVWIYIAMILITLPLTPKFRDYLANFLSIEHLVNGSLLLVIGVSIGFALAPKRTNLMKAFPYFLIWACGMLGLMMLIPLPIERIHIPEYGLLAVFLFRTFRLSRKSTGDAYRSSCLWAVTIGVLDELIQHLLPTRYFAVKDVGLNALGVIAGLWSCQYYAWVKKRAV